MERVAALKKQLNDTSFTKRIAAAYALGELIKNGTLIRTALEEVNNHVHTAYSFSPYYPASAAFAAWEAGLGIVGAIDHDSVGGAKEMLIAGEALGIATTVGFEVRTSFADSPFATKKINNPDSVGIVYMCVHGVKESALDAAAAFLEPIRVERNKRNRAQVKKLNTLIASTGLREIDFESDVVAHSLFSEGGTVTERHILQALALVIIEKVGKGEPVVEFLQQKLSMTLSPNLISLLQERENEHYIYDLLGVLKGSFLPRFFIQPSIEEAISVHKVVEFANSIGAIASYAYLGDVKESVTGDKKAEHFEDSFLEELIAYISNIGFPAVTYMPPRNTKEQMRTIQRLCQTHSLMEISGVDINSSRQSFNCPELLQKEAHHLIDSAWALVAHEKLANYNEKWALFHSENPLASKSLANRIKEYATLGKGMDPFDVKSIIKEAEVLFNGEKV